MFDRFKFYTELAAIVRELAAAKAANDPLAAAIALRKFAALIGFSAGGDVVGRLIEVAVSGNTRSRLDAVGDAFKFAATFFPEEGPTAGIMSVEDQCEALAVLCEGEASKVLVSGANTMFNPALIPVFIQIGIQVFNWLRERRQAKP